MVPPPSDRPPLRLIRADEPSRNAPCPCGSGRKYKQCHGREGEMAGLSQHARLVLRLRSYATQRFGDQFDFALESLFFDPAEVMEFAGAWLLFHAEFDGRSALEWLLDDPAESLTAEDRRWYQDQHAAWVGVWEVVEVNPGLSIRLVDQLTGTARTVRERTASRTVKVRDALLARVVEHENGAELDGVYPKSLAPVDAAAVVAEMRRKLRRRREIPAERLRPEKMVYHLIATWENVRHEAEGRAMHLPTLRNTDGDEILWTVDHFACDPEHRDRAIQLLSTMPDIRAPDLPGEHRFSIVRPESDRPDETRFTVLGTFGFSPRGIVVETNSLRRADAFRRRLEEATEGLLRHRAREHPGGTAFEQLAGPGGMPQEMTQVAMQEFRERYDTEWLDQPIPMLDHQTPRQASKTAEGRRLLKTLLKDYEHRQGDAPEGFTGPDVARLRRELGMEDRPGSRS